MLQPPLPHLTMEAELFYLHHLRSCAERCEGFIRWTAEAYGKTLSMYFICRLCGPGTMRCRTAVALASGYLVFATALFHVLTPCQPFESCFLGALRLACAHAALITIALGLHAPQLWQCKVISALFLALFCSESSLPMALCAMHSWDSPTFPPKLTSERIQERLTELRAYVSDHAHVLRLRPGSSVLHKLRQTASEEEKAWHNLLMKAAQSFTAAHVEYLAGTYALISEAVQIEAVDSSAALRALDEADGDASGALHGDFAGQPGFTSSGNLKLGGMNSRTTEAQVLYGWRRQFRGAANIYTPWRHTMDEALQDYA